MQVVSFTDTCEAWGSLARSVGGIEISTDLSPIERRVGLLCAVAKLNMGVLTFTNYPILYNDKKKSSKMKYMVTADFG